MFDGNGNWTSDFSAQADRDNGIKILASRFDNIFIADIKESFENCLTKDGQITPIGNFNMGGQRITNLNNGVNDNDAVNMSQLDTKANSSDVVNLTGTQTITGEKAFTNKVEIRGANGHILFHIPGTIFTRLQESANGLEVRTGDNISLAPLFVGDSDINHSVISTLGINKSSNGYVKLGNGIIIQWGRSSTTDGYVTFPTPFSNACTAVIPSRISSGDALSNIFENASTTGFKIKIDGGYSSSAYFYWIAVGY